MPFAASSEVQNPAEIIAMGIPGATSNRAPTQTDIDTQQSSDNSDLNWQRLLNERDPQLRSQPYGSTQRPSSQITGIQAAVLIREMEVVNPETGLTEVQEIRRKSSTKSRRLLPTQSASTPIVGTA